MLCLRSCVCMGVCVFFPLFFVAVDLISAWNDTEVPLRIKANLKPQERSLGLIKV